MCQRRVGRRFIDTVRLFVKGGTGGMGLPRYRGIGGRGGSVILEAHPDISMRKILQQYSKGVISAQSGGNSKTKQIFGSHGEDKVVKVPVGVTVYDEFMRIIGELNIPGEKLVVAEGGPGGSPVSRPPYSGCKGFGQNIIIDLKLISDVALVGFPNAGKSTLLKALSRAKPKIADYSFTTLQPNLGILEYSDLRQIKMADLPGLIEGSSFDLGMGHSFLKHVERSTLLLMIVDIQGFQLNPETPNRSCLDSVILLNKELELYKEELLDKPAVLAVNKMDLPGAVGKLQEITPHLENLKDYASRMPEELRPKRLLKFDKIVPISAEVDKDSTKVLKNVLRDSLDKYYELSVLNAMEEKELELLRRIRKRNNEIAKVID